MPYFVLGIVVVVGLVVLIRGLWGADPRIVRRIFKWTAIVIGVLGENLFHALVFTAPNVPRHDTCWSKQQLLQIPLTTDFVFFHGGELAEKVSLSRLYYTLPDSRNGHHLPHKRRPITFRLQFEKLQQLIYDDRVFEQGLTFGTVEEGLNALTTEAVVRLFGDTLEKAI